MKYTKFEFEMEVQKEHLDDFGHVNNAVYLQFLEKARWEILNGSNLGMTQIIKDQKGPVVLEINIQYRSELKQGDRIQIFSQAMESNNKIVQMGQQIIKKNGDLSAKAKITIGLMDLKLRRLIEFDATWQNCLGFST